MRLVTTRNFLFGALFGATMFGACASAAMAEATDSSQVGCPLTSLTAAERAGLDQHIIDEGANDDPHWRAFLAAVDRCSARFHWSRSFSEYVFHYNFLAEAQVATRRLFAEQRVEIGELERLLLADPAISGARGAQAHTAAVRDFIGRHQAMAARLVQGKPNPGRILNAIGVFLFARAMQDELRDPPVAN